MAKVVRVGDGRTLWTEGDVCAQVDFGPVQLTVCFAVLKTTAFDAILGIKFLQKAEVQSIEFDPPRLVFKNEVSPTSKMLMMVDQEKKHLESQLIACWHDEAYRLVQSSRDQVLQALQVKPVVDLFANAHNHTESLWCSPKWSAWSFDWGALGRESGVLWCNPPFSKMLHVLTKIA